jgi:hypothetical protein
MKKLIAFSLILFAGLAFALDPFRAGVNTAQKISVTNSNVATALNFANRAQYVLVTPATNTDLIFIEFGTSGSVATTTTSYPLLPGMKETVSVWGPTNSPTHIAAISGSGTQILYVSAGAGE